MTDPVESRDSDVDLRNAVALGIQLRVRMHEIPNGFINSYRVVVKEKVAGGRDFNHSDVAAAKLRQVTKRLILVAI